MWLFLNVIVPVIRAILGIWKDSSHTVHIVIRKIVLWHRKQMATDPAYATILAIIAAGILRLTVRNRANAAMLAVVIAKALGLNVPDPLGNTWDSSDDYD